MKRLCLIFALFCGCFAQSHDPSFPTRGKQRDMIVKDDYKKNVRDSAELARLAEELKTDLANGDQYVISIRALKDADDIDKLARNIRGRLKRY